MTQEKLNEYILQYIKEDKTKSAIMLTGDWGTGKSHYILNNMVPFLMHEENGKHESIIVSLYGLKETLEISRSIYMECRAKFLKNKSEKLATGMFIGKTVIKGLAGRFGFDFSQADEDMTQLYESVNLSGKLIVLEDLERSSINILDVLGYVNSLTEQDDVKVLLVANENEIIKKETKTRKNEKGKDESYQDYTEETEKYLRIKEKTVSDTIHFEEDWESATKQIIEMFNNETLNRFANSETAKDVSEIMFLCSSYNLRSFIFACQKTVDIYQCR